MKTPEDPTRAAIGLPDQLPEQSPVGRPGSPFAPPPAPAQPLLPATGRPGPSEVPAAGRPTLPLPPGHGQPTQQPGEMATGSASSAFARQPGSLRRVDRPRVMTREVAERIHSGALGTCEVLGISEQDVRDGLWSDDREVAALAGVFRTALTQRETSTAEVKGYPQMYPQYREWLSDLGGLERPGAAAALRRMVDKEQYRKAFEKLTTEARVYLRDGVLDWDEEMKLKQYASELGLRPEEVERSLATASDGRPFTRTGANALPQGAMYSPPVVPSVSQIHGSGPPAPAQSPRRAVPVIGCVVAAVVGLLLLGAAIIAGVFVARGRDSGETAGASASASSGPAIPTLAIKGSSTVNDQVAKDWAQAFMQTHPDVRVLVESTGSGPGFEALLNGQVPLIASSRAANDKEKTKAKALGIDLESPESERVIALDAIAIIVHPANPLGQMTVEQVRSVFTGKATDWKQVGGASGPIKVIIRPKELGAYEVFKDLVLGKDARFIDGADVVKLNRDLSEKVSADPQAISFIAFNGVGNAKALRLSATRETLAVAPSTSTIRDRSYLLTRKLYLYSRGAPEGLAAQFAELALGAGQDAVTQAGFVSIRVNLVDSSARDATRPRVASGAKGKKFNTDLRFRTGTFDLDNLGRADLDAIAATLCASASAGTMVELVGHTDSVGAADQNQTLSEQRAASVAKLLAQKCARVAVRSSGLGARYPVGDNADEEGRLLNRRVEVWVYEL